MASFPGRKKNARREDNDIKTEPLRIKTPLHSLQGRFALDSDLKTDSCNLRKRCISLVIKPEREDLCDSNILSILVHLNSGSTGPARSGYILYPSGLFSGQALFSSLMSDPNAAPSLKKSRTAVSSSPARESSYSALVCTKAMNSFVASSSGRTAVYM